ncbi:MAG: peroxiredoxin [Hyphomonadaceae bacterium]
MSQTRATLVGDRLPSALLAELIDGQVVSARAYDVLGQGRTLAIGVPGAFTPTCSDQHVPGLVNNADRLRRSGFDHLVCIVASDPFVTHAWSKVVDRGRKVRFVSDGNLYFARALGLTSHEQKLFLGERSERYLMVARSGIIETVRVEAHIASYTCTQPDDLVL